MGDDAGRGEGFGRRGVRAAFGGAFIGDGRGETRRGVGLACCLARDGERRRTGEIELRFGLFGAGEAGNWGERVGDLAADAPGFVGDLRVGEAAGVCFVDAFGGDAGIWSVTVGAGRFC